MISDKFFKRIRAKQKPLFPSLKPCPFCGEDSAVSTWKNITMFYKIECTGFNCSIMPETLFEPTIEGAAEIWNERKG